MVTLSGHKKSVGVLAPKKTSSLSKALGSLSASVVKAVTPTKALSNAQSNFTNNFGQSSSVSKPKVSAPRIGVSSPKVLGNLGWEGSVGVIAPKGTSSGSTVNKTSNFTNNFGLPLTNNRSFSSTSGLSGGQLGSTTGLGSNASSVPLSSVAAGAIKPVVPVDLTGTNPNDYLDPNAQYGVGVADPNKETDQQKAQKEDEAARQKWMDSILDVPSSADSFNRAFEQSGKEQAQQNVNALTEKLGGIVNHGEALKLSLVGQGRGIPEAIIGGQQAQIARETAIQALPVQAQLEAAQGNLEMANDSLDRLFKIYSDDDTNRYNARNKQLEAVVGYLDKKEQRLWDEQKTQNDRAYAERQASKKANEDMIKNAFAQGAPMGITNKALEILKNGGSQVDVAQTLGLYAGDVLERQLKLAQIDAARASASKTRAETEKASGQSTAAQSVVDVARELLNNTDLGAITGTVQQLTGGFMGDQAKLAKNKWKQLKGMLSLESRQQLKGSGAISDFEFRVLSEASSALGRNLSDETFKTELQKLINNLSQGSTSNSTSSGNTYVLKQPNGQINNNQGVTASGIGFTIKP